MLDHEQKSKQKGVLVVEQTYHTKVDSLIKLFGVYNEITKKITTHPDEKFFIHLLAWKQRYCFFTDTLFR